MKCSCGTEIPGGAKFCGKCGKMVNDTASRRCKTCGVPLYPGARFCGKCRTPVSLAAIGKSAGCRTGGAAPVPGAEYGGKRGTPVSGDTPKDTVRNAVHVLREKARPARDWADSKIVNKERARKILIIALVIGLCFIVSGFAGKISMGKVSDTLKNSDYFSGMGSDLDGILNRSAGNAMTRLLVSVIKNDPSGFLKTINQLTGAASSMAGDPYGMNGLGSMLISTLAEEAFAEARSQLIQEAGVYWPLLQAMAYYHELLTVGFIIAIAAAVLWFLLDGKPGDIKALRLQPVLYVGAGWSALVTVVTVIGFTVLKI